MNKFIITLTDREFYSELDLRKKKLQNLNVISFFKIDEYGNVLNHNCTHMFFGNFSVKNAIKRFLNDNLSKNQPSLFNNQYITTSTFDSFIKFSKKYGKVTKIDVLDPSFLNGLNSFEEIQKNILFQIKKLESSFKKIDYLDKKGRYRKIDCKNIIINTSNSSSKNKIFISDEKTNITHIIENNYNDDIKLQEKLMNYYCYYNLGDKITIFKTNKKGRIQYLDLMKQLSDLNKELSKSIEKYLLDLFQ